MKRAAIMVMAIFLVFGEMTPTVIQGVGQRAFWAIVTMRGIRHAAAQGTPCVEDWERLVIRAVGKGVAPFARYPVRAQAKVMAEEAGRAMAYGRFCECIAGVQVTSGITIKDGVPGPQELVKFCDGFIKGARVVHEDVVMDAEAATGVVTLELSLRGDRGLEGQLPANLRPTPPQPQPGQEMPGRPPSSPAAPTIDGLILDARGLSGRPALYPQVLAEGGRTVYHWHSVDREYRELFGRVTNTPEKAKTLMREQGVTNPLVVKVSRMEGLANYVLSAEDAKKVISADLDGQFLRKSRVVFVLGL